MIIFCKTFIGSINHYIILRKKEEARRQDLSEHHASPHTYTLSYTHTHTHTQTHTQTQAQLQTDSETHSILFFWSKKCLMSQNFIQKRENLKIFDPKCYHIFRWGGSDMGKFQSNFNYSSPILYGRLHILQFSHLGVKNLFIKTSRSISVCTTTIKWFHYP